MEYPVGILPKGLQGLVGAGFIEEGPLAGPATLTDQHPSHRGKFVVVVNEDAFESDDLNREGYQLHFPNLFKEELADARKAAEGAGFRVRSLTPEGDQDPLV